MASDAGSRFVRLVQQPEGDVPLGEAALLIGAAARPGVDVAAGLGRLDALAAACPAPTLEALRRHLYGREGFRGNRDDYYDPANSYLDQVLERRLGIPITLAVVLMEVGQRIGVDIEGVNAPAHFLVRHGDRVLDPFDGAAEVAAGDLPPDALAPAGAHAILARMLGNLKQVFLERGDVGSLRWVLELRTVVPGVPDTERQELRRLLAQFN
jgi:regulator of sirC expression with transglutaminase-like and TPR domain